VHRCRQTDSLHCRYQHNLLLRTYKISRAVHATKVLRQLRTGGGPRKDLSESIPQPRITC
jgi:hypothetical protein